jgi:hypothetical protein
MLILMPLNTESYQANAKKCENRAEEMPPALRRELLMAARHWRKLASVAEKRGPENNEAKDRNENNCTRYYDHPACTCVDACQRRN